VRSFYRLLWDGTTGDQLQLNQLVGSHDPSALLNVHTSKACQNADYTALVAPRTASRRVLVYHKDAVRSRRQELVDFFMKHVGAVSIESKSDSFSGQSNASGRFGLSKNVTPVCQPLASVFNPLCLKKLEHNLDTTRLIEIHYFLLLLVLYWYNLK